MRYDLRQGLGPEQTKRNSIPTGMQLGGQSQRIIGNRHSAIKWRVPADIRQLVVRRIPADNRRKTGNQQSGGENGKYPVDSRQLAIGRQTDTDYRQPATGSQAEITANRQLGGVYRQITGNRPSDRYSPGG